MTATVPNPTKVPDTTNIDQTKKVDVFLENSQGLYFFYNPKNAIFSKILRAMILILATYGAVFVCVLNSKRYFDSVTQTVVQRTDLHVSSIDFPAVTICPLKITASNLTEEAVKYFLSGNATEKEVQTMLEILEKIHSFMNQLHFQNINTSFYLENAEEQDFFDRRLESIKFRDFMKFLSTTCEEVFKECAWRRIKQNCCEILKPQNVYGNLCFSFNSMLVDDPPLRPWRVPDSGKWSALRVIMNRHIATMKKGEKEAIFIHEPMDIPISNLIQMEGHRTTVTIDPLHFATDSDVISLPPQYRRCFFRDEKRPLGMTRSHCIQLCRQKYILEQCNCSVDFDFPNGDEGTCNLSHFKCLYEHRYALGSSGNILIPLTSSDDETTEAEIYDCQCYQNCNYVQYKTTVHVATDIEKNENRTIELHVHFNQDTLFSYRTSFIFKFLDLLVSYGGVAGLFLGFSFVGAVEILQQFCLIRKEKIKKKISFRRLQGKKKSQDIEIGKI
ncbi:hypothetical protein ACFFRR_007216 [Megaselia abdita]